MKNDDCVIGSVTAPQARAYVLGAHSPQSLGNINLKRKPFWCVRTSVWPLCLPFDPDRLTSLCHPTEQQWTPKAVISAALPKTPLGGAGATARPAASRLLRTRPSRPPHITHTQAQPATWPQIIPVAVAPRPRMGPGGKREACARRRPHQPPRMKPPQSPGPCLE